MGQRRLFAVGKQTLSSVVKQSVTTVAWQLAVIPWCCRVCSKCKLLLNSIHALKHFVAIVLWWRLRRKMPLQHCFWSTQRESISLTIIDWCQLLYASPFFFPRDLPVVSLKLQRFLSASHLQWNSWPAPDPLMFHAPEVTLTRAPSLWHGTFSYAKIYDSVLRWKDSLTICIYSPSI